ncbi:MULTISPECIES: DUF58 domain-containing protein [unclassified Spirosoma]|uniref:DUF58 domain-containing protein n=1 Tax=unclassified Spirosoma TaxID=2621999 RepID=UPI00095CAC5F|nr:MULTISPECIES: DUF58 domain-containing protein [unclassified Spirosoma]MBN8820485.1 DUF58 domain-containing protein [Spirosoma sp.]OJW72680.1 MAG: hypothetical protein BGO59_16330 [Spirosoma sp. 48-14]
MDEFLARLRNFDIRIRKAVNSQMRGSFRSVFKGTGLEFTDLRTYQYGDDVRAIDWNVSSKGHGTFVKVFREEKDQTVFFVVDVSASQHVGPSYRDKLAATKEVCGVLALSAIREASHVGMYCFSDQKEKYIRPSNGLKTGYQLIMSLYKLKPESGRTSIADALLFTLNALKRRSVVILLSDFIDQQYEHNLKALAKKHDLVVIHLYDQREVKLPRLGIIPVHDTETGRTVWVNTSSAAFRNSLHNTFQQNQVRLERLCKQYNANYLALDSQEDFVPKLVELFRVRK